MTQQYTPVTWQDETTSQQGTLINAERLNQMQTAHHFTDGFEEVDAVPTADPSVAYHKVVYCTADSTFYRWDGTEWTADIDDDTKRLLEQEIERATAVEHAIAGDLSDETSRAIDAESEIIASLETETSNRVAADTALGTRITAEAATREAEDSALSDAIEAEATARSNAVGAEAQLRATADTGLQQSIDGESSRAIAKENELASSLTTETAARIAEDTALQESINEEKGIREQADGILESAIVAEANTRAEADTAMDVRVANLTADVARKAYISDGVTPWSSTVTYAANAFTNVNGTLYRSLSADNTGHPPASSPTWWSVYSPASGSSGLIGPDNLYTEDIGDGSATTIAVTHNLGSYDVLWCLWSNSDKGVTGVKAVKTSTNVLTLTFATAPAADEYRVLVFRPGDAARIYEQTFSPASNEVVITHNLGRLPSGISLYAPDGTRVGARMSVDTTSITLHLAGYDAGQYTIQVIA